MAGFLGTRRRNRRRQNFVMFVGQMLRLEFFSVPGNTFFEFSLTAVVLNSIKNFCRNLFPRVFHAITPLTLDSSLSRMGYPLLDKRGSHKMHRVGKLFCSKVAL